MWRKGREKLKEDFNILKIFKSIHDFRVMFKYYREKHAELMIDVNSNRRSVINLEDDEWESELDRAKPYMTKFDTFQSSSDNVDGSDDYSRSYSGSYSRSKDGK